MSKLISGLFSVTMLRYLLVAGGGILVANGWTSEEEWATISGALLVLIPAIFGIIISRQSRVVTPEGKKVQVKELPAAVQQQTKAAAKQVAADKPNLIEALGGLFGARR